MRVARCFKPYDFGKVATVQLHHFSDASTVGYGQCTYLRLVNADGRIHCCLVLAKARSRSPRKGNHGATVGAECSCAVDKSEQVFAKGIKV